MRQTWIRPNASADDVSELLGAVTQRNDVAKGDAVVVQVKANGYLRCAHNDQR